LDKPLHVIYKTSKIAYRILVILIANERVKKKISQTICVVLGLYSASCIRAPNRYKTADFRQQHSDRKYYVVASPTGVLDAKTY
jgi:hypothetical protein